MFTSKTPSCSLSCRRSDAASLSNDTGPIPDVLFLECGDDQRIQELSELAGEIWREHYTPLIGPEQVEYMLDRFQSSDAIRRQIREESYRYFLGTHGDRPAGYCALKKEADGALFLSKFYIHKDFRGRGFGRKMLEYATARCDAPEGTRVFLTVNKGNADSIAAYRRLGFKMTGEITTEIGAGFIMDDYTMEKVL